MELLKTGKKDEVTLTKSFIGKKVEGWKFDFNYSVTITSEGFVTRNGEVFKNLQPAVNQDILNNGLPTDFLPGVTVWTQGSIGNNRIEEVL